MDVLALGGLTAMMNGVNLPETGDLPLLTRVEGAYGDAAFQGIQGFGETFPLESEGRLVLFEISVYGRGADFYELFRDFTGDAEGLPLRDVLHLRPHKRREDLPALVPEKGPDESKTGDDLIGVDPCAFPIRGPLFSGLRFTAFPSA
ncbi:MAG: hypothetical protein LBS82_05510 [Spirochaetaceae bacterium]|jgi:hypothetical protein|nr:hypothetical protein [Spirochaetaceae bacterium]